MKILLLLPIILLCSCSRGQGISLYPYIDKQETHSNFNICHGFSCTYKTNIIMSDHQWDEVTDIFAAPSQNAAQERDRIARAIALIETKVTKISGMNPDRAKAENFERDQDQMDCLDETINTSLYLRLLDKEGVMIWNKPDNPIHRGFFIDGMWPHNSATVKELATGKIYAIDTYYRNNGQTPPIVPKNIWLKNWRPDGG